MKTLRCMMMVMTVILTMCFGVSIAGAAVCNEKSSLGWKMNTEPDMDHYTVYHDTVTVVKGAATVQSFNVPHDPTAAVPDPVTGELQVIQLFPSLPEGDRFFRVSASDKAVPANESDPSNEVTCTIDMTPGVPTLFLKFGS